MKIQPSLSIPVFYAFATVAFFYKFLFANLYGILITCLLLYWKSETLFGIVPLSADGLILWIAAQNVSTRTTLLGALITIVGFLIAYTTATANWKSQLLANLKAHAAGEIEVLFAECSKLATDCEIYASALVKAVDKIQKGCSPDEAAFLCRYNRDQGQPFLQNRQRLAALSVDVHRLHGKYSTILFTAPGLKSGLDSAIRSLSIIADKLWINVPYHLEHDQNPVQSFVNQINIKDCIALINAVAEEHLELSYSSGGVRGNLMATVVGFNFWTLFYMYKHRHEFKMVINERYKNLIK